MESAMAKLGGHMIALQPGAGSWGMSFGELDEVMDGAQAEHIKEAAGVLSSYADAIALRAFSDQVDFGLEMQDLAMWSLVEHASKPVISLESACFHPCQALADALTLTEQLGGSPRGKKFVLSWAPHPKLCGVAVPHSALLTAARLGMDVTLAVPEEAYMLAPAVLEKASQLAQASGGSLQVSDDPGAAAKGAQVIYAKAWGAPQDWGHPLEQGVARNQRHAGWMVDAQRMEAAAPGAGFMHCLPVRRNVVVSSEVLDSSASWVQQQAANRLWAQQALLLQMLSPDHEMVSDFT
jgi:N-acetylornithine carbamoyltransferase